MVSKFEFIKDITNRKDMWKVTLKVNDKWTTMKNGKEYFKMVVYDTKVSF
jgi:hypothetical protein